MVRLGIEDEAVDVASRQRFCRDEAEQVVSRPDSGPVHLDAPAGEVTL